MAAITFLARFQIQTPLTNYEIRIKVPHRTVVRYVTLENLTGRKNSVIFIIIESISAYDKFEFTENSADSANLHNLHQNLYCLAGLKNALRCGEGDFDSLKAFQVFLTDESAVPYPPKKNVDYCIKKRKKDCWFFFFNNSFVLFVSTKIIISNSTKYIDDKIFLNSYIILCKITITFYILYIHRML